MVERLHPEPVPLIQQKHPCAVYLRDHRSELSTPHTELMVVILERTHSNLLFVWLLTLGSVSHLQAYWLDRCMYSAGFSTPRQRHWPGLTHQLLHLVFSV